MSCRKIKKLLVSYYEDSLDVEANNLVQNHLRTCQDCREELREIESLFELLTQEKTDEIEPRFWTNFVPVVKERIGRVSQPKFGWSLFPKLGPIFGLAIAIVLVGIFLFTKDYPFLNQAVSGFEGEAIHSLYDFESTTDELAEALSLTESTEGMAGLVSADDEQSLSTLEQMVEYQYWERIEWDDLLEDLSSEELDLLEEKIENITI